MIAPNHKPPDVPDTIRDVLLRCRVRIRITQERITNGMPPWGLSLAESEEALADLLSEAVTALQAIDADLSKLL